jgi:hypothetical protein
VEEKEVAVIKEIVPLTTSQCSEVELSMREIQMKKKLKSAIKIQNTDRLSCKLTIMIFMV